MPMPILGKLARSRVRVTTSWLQSCTALAQADPPDNPKRVVIRGIGRAGIWLHEIQRGFPAKFLDSRPRGALCLSGTDPRRTSSSRRAVKNG